MEGLFQLELFGSQCWQSLLSFKLVPRESLPSMQKATEKLSLLFSSCFAAGALAPAEPDQARTIYQAVVDKNWGTAKELLRAISEGKLSGTV